MAERRLALVIANYECDDAIIKEKIPPSRAPESLVHDLSDPEIGGFEVVQSLFNEPSNKVRKTLGDFFNNAQPNDLLLLYITGYGIKDEGGRLYLITKDTEFRLLSSTSVSWVFLSDLLSDIPSQKKIIIMDCCYIGKMREGVIARADKDVCSLEPLKGPESILITPSEKMQCYLEGNELIGNIPPSSFTAKFSRGLRGEADFDRDGLITVADIIEQSGSSMMLPGPNTWSSIPPESIILARTPKVRHLTAQEGISETKSSPEIQKLIRYPAMECPDKAILNQRFSLFVQLLVNPSRPDVTNINKIEIEDKGIPGQEPELEIVVLARGFDIEGSNTKVLKIDRTNDSDERFVLIPKEIGDQQIRVDFYQYGRRIGTERRNVLVTESQSPAATDTEVKQPIPSLSLELKPYLQKPPLAPDLELCVELDQNDGHTLYFRLHSIKEDVGYNHAKFGSVKLMGSPLEKMKALYEELTKIAENPGEDAEQRMAALGNDLWRDLIPDELKREYWRFRNNVQSMLITSDEPWIQWEAIKPYRYNEDTGEREDEPFWCQKFRLSRWLSGPGAADDLPAGEARPVAPVQVDLPSVREEVTFVEHLGDLNSRVPGRASFSDKAQVLDLLEKGSFSVLHFATHGNFDSDQPDNSPILLSGGDLKPSDIHVRFGRRRPRPLIFINACKGAQMDFGFTGLGGWADRLVKEAGVGAFAGAMWSVNDSLAMEFAKHFYTSLLKDNQTISQAFHTAREEIRKADPANSTWLAYVLYADPEGRIQDQ